MNKFILGLLLIAAVAGTFFVLQKQKTNTTVGINKELIFGKWKIKSYDARSDSSNALFVGMMALIDSNTLKYSYEFTKDGKILRFLGDTASKDTSLFEWKGNMLLWKEEKEDTVGEQMLVNKLIKDTLLLQCDDSTQISFIREK